jgi:hypothetical protein
MFAVPRTVEMGHKRTRCSWFLWNYRSRNDYWIWTWIHEHRPDQNADLECVIKRHCCSAYYGYNDGYRSKVDLMGRFKGKPWLLGFGWGRTALMAGAVIALIWSSLS